jgi:hypothetical protein
LLNEPWYRYRGEVASTSASVGPSLDPQVSIDRPRSRERWCERTASAGHDRVASRPGSVTDLDHLEEVIGAKAEAEQGAAAELGQAEGGLEDVEGHDVPEPVEPWPPGTWSRPPQRDSNRETPRIAPPTRSRQLHQRRDARLGTRARRRQPHLTCDHASSVGARANASGHLLGKSRCPLVDSRRRRRFSSTNDRRGLARLFSYAALRSLGDKDVSSRGSEAWTATFPSGWHPHPDDGYSPHFPI